METVLQPMDIVTAYVLAVLGEGEGRPVPELAHAMRLQPAEFLASLQRLVTSRLISPRHELRREALAGFVVHAAPHLFPTRPSGHGRGVPTAHAAPCFADLLVGAEPFVWSDSGGDAIGSLVEPLHHAVPDLARRSAKLYELLAATDLLRIGRARERAAGRDMVEGRLAA